MPELPDVESFRLTASRCLRRRILSVEVLDPKRVLGVPAVDLSRRLRGRSFSRAARHGKWLFLETGGPALALHFGMTGDLSFLRGSAVERFPRLRVFFEDGSRLVYEDMRRFGAMSLTDDPGGFVRERGLGPDAGRIGLREWLQRLDRQAGAVKAALMGQRLVAGLGNLWVDELLFQTGLHPGTKMARIDGDARRRMFRTMKRILRAGIRTAAGRGPLPAGYLLSGRQPGGRCPRDGSRWRIATVAGRTTYWCPRHQPSGRRRSPRDSKRRGSVPAAIRDRA